MDDEPSIEEVVEVPKCVLDKINDPDAYMVKMHGACMNRRYPENCLDLISPNSQPVNGSSVIAEYNGETICRVYRKGEQTLMLSPDSFDPSFSDLVFDDAEAQEVRFQDVVRWFQASKVED